LDTDTKVVQANEGFERIFGYSLEEIKGRAIKELIVPKDRIEETSAVSRTVSNGQVFRKEFVRIRKDGSPIDVSLVAYPIRLDGKVVGTYSIYSDITKRKQMEQTLREAEEEKSTLLEEAPVSIIHADLNGRITYVNKRFEVESGYLREEVIGKIAFELGWFSGDTAKYLAERMAARLRGDAAKHWETQFRCRDGHRIWIELEGKVTSKVGAPVGYQIVASNVTERKEAEEALRQSEEKYRTILEEMEDAYFEVDLGGHLTFVNNSVCRDLGYSREELIGMSYRAFTAENDIDSVFRVFNEVYRTGVPNKGSPWKTIRKDGVQGFAETSISPLRDNTGEIIGFRGVGRDITDRRKTEQKLRQSEENYRTLFNNSVIGTVVLDADTARIVMINQAALKMFGFTSPEEASREEAFDFVLPDDKERYLEITKTAVFKQNSHEGYQVRALTKEGREIWINMTAAKVMHEGRLATLISFTDITEQMRQRERLMMTDRMASLGELAAGTAHELNNPLTSILGFSQLLMERNVPDDIREDVKIIYSEAQRAANVTKDLLTFARKQAPVKQLNQINSVVEDVLELRAYVHEMNGIEVKKHLARDLPELMVDYFQMQQVFLNIIINAEYFMSEAHNGGTLTITTKKQNGTVVISIADDGPGIPPENLKRVFDPFFTTKEAGKGTGLGLSICHGIVTEHGGQIYVKSQLGKGAIVLVELPVKGQRPDSGLL
jgi:two-component system, NtrC family, sensor kinase